MGIGQQFLMHPKTKINSFSKSSIIFDNNDNFTYCDSENLSSIKLNQISLTKGKALENWILKNNIENDSQLIISNNAGLFIPEALFDKNFITDYYDKFDKMEESDIIESNLSCNHLNSIIFKVPNKLQSVKAKYLNKSKFFHYQTLIYNYLISESKQNSDKKLYVNIQKDSFDFFLFFSDQLILANRFPNNGSDSFLYFLYFIVEKNELKENEFFISFLGRYSNYNEYYSSSKLFHDKIEFILEEESHPKGNNSSTPFLLDLHAHYFRHS